MDSNEETVNVINNAWDTHSFKISALTKNETEIDKLIFSLGLASGIEYARKQLMDNQSKGETK